MTIANTMDFSGGLNALADSAKLAAGQYSLAVNARTRSNTIAPTARHQRIALPVDGPIQAIYAQGSTLFVFIAGVAYTADLTTGAATVILRPIASWTAMSSTAEQIFLETVPATWNVLNRVASNPQDVQFAFNGSLAAFRECLIVQDGVNIPRAIFPDGTWTTLGSYSTWTYDNPLYVPIGKQMAYGSGKLYVVSPDGLSIYQSVSGRPTDFMIVIDNDGNPLGDVDTSSIGVSYSPITFIRATENGSLLAATLYGTWLLVPDPTNLFWGEPYITPVPQFPIGFLNQQSYADISGDTAFLTQSGVQSFNITEQLKISSNNQPIGAPISSILSKPQSITAAAINFDDYAFFGLNTIFGALTAVYDTMTAHYVSLDNSFGTVKYFARVLTENTQQLVFATDGDELYLAYADAGVNVSAVYLGDFVARDGNGVASGNFMRATALRLSFVDVYSSGEVSIQVYADRKLIYSATQTIEATLTRDTDTQPFPYTSQTADKSLSFQFSEPVQGWKLGVFVSWNCDASLSEAALHGDTSARNDLGLKGETTAITPDRFAAVGNITLGTNFASGGSNPAGRTIFTTKDNWYLFDPGETSTTLVDSGKVFSKRGIFKSSGMALVYGDNSTSYSFRNVNDFKTMLSSMVEDQVTTFVSLGNLGDGSNQDIEDILYLIEIAGLTFQGAIGDLDNANKVFYNAKAGTRYPYSIDYNFTDWVFYNSYSNYLGYDVNSLQAKWQARNFSDSTKRFKFVALHKSAYTSATSVEPGDSSVRLLYRDVDGVFSAEANVAEYLAIRGVNYFVNGLGGGTPDTFTSADPSVFRFNEGLAYYFIEVNNVTANVFLKDQNGTTLASKIIYG